MGYLLLTLDADEGAIRAALASLGSDPAHVWLEDTTRPDGFQLRVDVADGEWPGLLRAWPEGHLFSPRADIRWEHQDDDIYIVAIADEMLPATFEGKVELIPLDARMSDDEPTNQPEGEPERWLLWGERRRDGWFEERIPNLADRIPATWSGRYAALLTRVYEAAEPVRGAEEGPRLVTRYLAFDTDYAPAIDKRFT